MAPRPQVHRVRGVIVAGLLAVAAGACGSSSTSKAASVSTVTTTTVATTTSLATTTTLKTVPTTGTSTTRPPLPSIAQDVAAARQILLKPSDLPGYSPSPSADINGYVSNYATCSRDPLLPGGKAERAASQGGFLLDETAAVRAAQTTSVSSFAAFADTEADARRVFTELA